jgi:cob(I)alamin adenosyltransferase
MGYVYLYTGNGAGKSTSALGLALRALGHNKKVVIIQFLKWNRDTGEYLFKHPNYEIYQFNRTEWIRVATLGEEDKEVCKDALATAYIKGMNNDTFLLILDEINYAVSVGMLEDKDVVEMIYRLRDKRPDINIVMTGRGATRKLRKLADFINEINEIKSSGMVCECGIQY